MEKVSLGDFIEIVADDKSIAERVSKQIAAMLAAEEAKSAKKAQKKGGK